jgi:hypothetical protein
MLCVQRPAPQEPQKYLDVIFLFNIPDTFYSNNLIEDEPEMIPLREIHRSKEEKDV